MHGKVAASLFAAVLLASAAAWPAEPAAGSAAAGAGEHRRPGRAAHPRARVEDLLPYENIRTARFADWHPKERRLLIRTRFAESPQLHEVAMPMGARTQLTFYRDPVSDGPYRPGDPDQVVYSLNEGGAENFQLFLLDRRTGRARRFTDGTHRYVSPRLVARRQAPRLRAATPATAATWTSTWPTPPTPGSERRVAEVQGSWYAARLEPGQPPPPALRVRLGQRGLPPLGGRRGRRRSTRSRRATRARTRRPSPTRAAAGRRTAGSVYTLVRPRQRVPAPGPPRPRDRRRDRALRRLPWDVEQFDLSDDGRLLAFFTNEDGISKLHLLDAATGAVLPAPELPAGVGHRPRSSAPARTRSASTSAGPAPPRTSTATTRTPAPRALDGERGRRPRPEASPCRSWSATPPSTGEERRRRTIPAFVYRPAADRFNGPRPVYINIHGGPEGQARPGFLGSNNYLINELGVALISPTSAARPATARAT